MGRFDERPMLVTGGAKGLGAAIAKRLASDGAHVAIIDLADAGETVEAIRGAGGVAEGFRGDVTSEEAMEAALKQVEARFGKLNVLVNNAGILSPRKAWNAWTQDEIRKFVDINFFGYWIKIGRAHV